MNYGFIRVAAAVPMVKVADCETNAQRIIELMHEAHQEHVQVVCFPELCITTYTCGDLFNNMLLLNSAQHALQTILLASKDMDMITIVGMPLSVNNQLFNCAVVLHKGIILAVKPKKYLPNNNEFYEARWFASSADAISTEIVLCNQHVPFGDDLLLHSQDLTFSIEICEDLWTPIPPSSFQVLAGAHIVFNLSASNELVGKHHYRRELIAQQAARGKSGYVYASAGIGESSTDLLFAGYAIIAENGEILAENERFKISKHLIISEIDIEKVISERKKSSCFLRAFTPLFINNEFRYIAFHLPERRIPDLKRKFTPSPFIPNDAIYLDSCHEAVEIQANALTVRLMHSGIQTVVLGISGGLDSTLALLAAVAAFDKMQLPRKNIIGITMPGFGTTSHSYQNAQKLMHNLQITALDIDIKEACLQHFKDINHSADVHDIVFENTQARERTQILMNIANQNHGLVIGTGDLSELALGWATYGGDHISMYAINAGVPKTLVWHLVRYIANQQQNQDLKELLLAISDTPISPELLPVDSQGATQQITEQVVGPYRLHDFFLFHFLSFGFTPRKIVFLAMQAFKDEYDKATIIHWLRVFLTRFFAQQFKRSCMPDGPKIGAVGLSPRGDWRMPSDASAAGWLADLDAIDMEQ